MTLINCVAFSERGACFVATTNHVVGFRLNNGDNFTKMFQCTLRGVTAMAVNAELGILAIVTDHIHLQVIDMRSVERGTVAKAQQNTSVLKLSVNSHYLMVLKQHVVEVLDRKNLTLVCSYNSDFLNEVSVSLSAKCDPMPFLVFRMLDQTVCVRQIRTHVASYIIHDESIDAIAINGICSKVAVASNSGMRITIYSRDSTVLQELHRGRYPTTISCMEFCPYNDYLVLSSSSTSVHVFDTNKEFVQSFASSIWNGLASYVSPAGDKRTSFSLCELPNANLTTKCYVKNILNNQNIVIVASKEGDLMVYCMSKEQRNATLFKSKRFETLLGTGV